MKKGWNRYALEERFIKKGYLRKHSDRNSTWKAKKTSNSNSLLSSQKEEEIVKPLKSGIEHESLRHHKTPCLQSESSQESIMAISDISRERHKCSRKTEHDKEHASGVQTKKGVKRCPKQN